VEKLKAACKASGEVASKPPAKPASTPKNGHEVEDVPQLAKRRLSKWGLQAIPVFLPSIHFRLQCGRLENGICRS